MKRIRLLIVDDESLIRSGIRDGLAERDDVEIAGECGSVSEAIDVLGSDEVDLVLLDVELPDGKGFDVIRRMGPERMPAVVFVTAYDKYAIQAFEVNAVDYLLKPFDQSRLLASLDRAKGAWRGPANRWRVGWKRCFRRGKRYGRRRSWYARASASILFRSCPWTGSKLQTIMRCCTAGQRTMSWARRLQAWRLAWIQRGSCGSIAPPS
jgi:two-component SAPR family response regulator